MNYLVHALLTPPDDALLVGNLSADVLVPGEKERLNPRVRQGVALHYLIDRTTDTHPAFRQACRLLSDRKIRYSGAFIDVIFDHILASGWTAYTDEPFDLFRGRVYRVIETKTELLPLRFQDLSFWIVSEDWFGDYRCAAGLGRAVYRLSRRMSFPVPLDEIHDIVREEREELETCFGLILNDLRQAVRRFSHSLADSGTVLEDPVR